LRLRNGGSELRASGTQNKVSRKEEKKKKGRRRVIDEKSWWTWFFAGFGPCQINTLEVEQGSWIESFVTGTQRHERETQQFYWDSNSSLKNFLCCFLLEDGST
jgi:hypothetical protein